MRKNLLTLGAFTVGAALVWYVTSRRQNPAGNQRSVTNTTAGGNVSTQAQPVTTSPLKPTLALTVPLTTLTLLRGRADPSRPSASFVPRATVNAKQTPFGNNVAARAARVAPIRAEYRANPRAVK